MDKQMHTGMILVELQKAFDALDHEVLLEKMKYFGFRASVIKWFESYLSNRKFLVCIDNVFLRLEHESAVYHKALFLDWYFFYFMFPNHYQTQASICMQMTPCILYQRQNVEKIENVLNKEFSSLCQWFIDNKLSVHFAEDKT